MAEPETLSGREKEVLRLVATGATNEQIARELVISINTVKVHLRNVFAKLGVASRTEASLYAIQQGWVTVETVPAVAAEPAPPVEAPPVSQPARAWPRWLAVSGMVILLLALILSFTNLPQRIFFPNGPTPALGPRWAVRPEMPTARSDLVLVSFGDNLYAIGGTGPDGVSNATECYDPRANVWTSLAAKPTAVTEAGGAILGGHIYVPGGRNAQGQPVATTEVYWVERNQWTAAGTLPRPLSAYALASFEGKLYLFGGWDGSQYRDEILRYDPEADRWQETGRLPFPWGHAGAIVVGNRILLIGGANEEGPLDVTLEYSPAQVTVQYTQPLSGISLGHVQTTILLDYLYVLAEPDGAAAPRLWQWNVRTTVWQEIEPGPAGLYPGVALAGMGTNLFLVGGENGEKPVPLVQEFQAIFVIPLPTPAP